MAFEPFINPYNRPGDFSSNDGTPAGDLWAGRASRDQWGNIVYPNQAAPQGSQVPPQGYQAGPQAGASAGKAIDDAWNLITVIGSYKAGRNHYEQTGDMGQAVAAGAGIFVRFNVWLVVWTFWMLQFFMGSWWNEAQDPNVTTALCLLIAPFCLGVTWCRNGDYGLFKRGPVYKLFAPIAKMVEPVPTGLLYALLLIPMFV